MNTDWLRAERANVNRRKGILTITMVGGVIVAIPLTRINDVFPNAIPLDDPRITNVRVEDNGSTIEWPKLEIDFSVAEMLPEFMGIVTARAAARKAASVKSPARSAAARANGAKGGRPRKKGLVSHSRLIGFSGKRLSGRRWVRRRAVPASIQRSRASDPPAGDTPCVLVGVEYPRLAKLRSPTTQALR